MGYQTIMALNTLDDYQLVTELKAVALQFYSDLITKNPSKYAANWDNWKARAEKSTL
jgi:hypothetical protein